MLSILSKILPFNTIQIVGVFLRENNTEYRLLTIKKKGSKLSVNSNNTYLDFNYLVEGIHPKLPLILVIDGKGVLNKKIDYNKENDVLWTKNLDYNSVHHSTLKTTDYSFVSFCRKQLAEEILSKFDSLQVPLIDFFIGSLQVYITVGFLTTDEVIANETVFKFYQNELDDVTKLKEKVLNNYKIGEDIVSSEYLSLYAAGIYFLMNENTLSKSESELIKKDEVIYKKGFNLIGTIGLLFFFCSLLISYLLINHFNSKNAELNLENVFSNQSYQLVLDLEKKKESKLKILNESGTFDSKYHSFYVNELANSLPEGLVLSRVNVAPLKKEIKGNERVDFNHNEIFINGSFYKESIFNEWIGELKKTEWIKSLEIVFIKKDKKNNLQFELKINV